jgi:hypothetical protein
MSHTTNIISVGSINTEPGSGYVAAFVQSFVPPELNVARVARDTDAPIAVHVTQAPRVFYLQVLVEDAAPDDVDARRRALLREFDSTRGPLTVVIENATGTPRRRFMLFVVGRPNQVEGQFGSGFMAPIESYDQVYWQSTVMEETTWTLDATATKTLSVAGDLDVYPTYTLTPNAAKTAPNWPYSRLVLVEWNSPYGGKHAVDVTDGGLDTAAMLSTGKITDGSNIAVMMNGTIRKHWYQESGATAFGTTTTQIWIEMEPRPAVQPWLTGYVSANATAWPIDGGAGMPASGTIKVGSEIVYYTHRTPGWLHGVSRAKFGTTAAEHAASSEITVYAGVGWIFYGPDAVTPESMKDGLYRAAKRPIMIVPGSSNAAWKYTDFAGAGQPMSWQYYSHLNNLAFVKESTSSGSYDPSSWQYPWTALGLAAGWTSISAFTLRLAVPVKDARAIGRYVARLNPAGSPAAPILKAWTDDGRSATSLLFWGSVARDANAAYDVTSPDVRPYDLDENPLPGFNKLEWSVAGASYLQADIQTLTVTFDPDAAPVVTMGAELTDYDLDLTIANNTTGESLTVQMPNMAPGESLVIDSQTQTVTYTLDGSNQYPAVRRDEARPKFLRLIPGTNELVFTEEGMGELEVTVAYRPRWYA